jgi:hypothetical protein
MTRLNRSLHLVARSHVDSRQLLTEINMSSRHVLRGRTAADWTDAARAGLREFNGPGGGAQWTAPSDENEPPLWTRCARSRCRCGTPWRPAAGSRAARRRAARLHRRKVA